MPTQIINPNWHVVLLHFPLGVFMLGLLLEILMLLVRYHGSARGAARWMVVLGALATLPAAYSGVYAMSDIVRRTAPSAPDDAPWQTVANASTLTSAQWELIDHHVWSNGGAAVLAAVVVTFAVGCSNRWRKMLYPVFLLALIAAAVGMARGAHFGGELVYTEGVGVQLAHPKGDSTTAPSTQSTSETLVDRAKNADRYLSPIQTHITLAGVMAAMGLLAIGLSMRAAATSPHWADPALARIGLSSIPNPQRGGAEDLAMIRSFMPSLEVTGEVEGRIPTSRFWLLTGLVAILTALAGWWTLGAGHHTFKPADLWSLVSGDGMIRRLAHLVAGVSIVVLPVFLAILARVARKSRVMIGLFSLLLIVAMTAQVWLGILLLLDRPRVAPGSGPWYRIQTEQTDATTRSVVFNINE